MIGFVAAWVAASAEKMPIILVFQREIQLFLQCIMLLCLICSIYNIISIILLVLCIIRLPHVVSMCTLCWVFNGILPWCLFVPKVFCLVKHSLQWCMS